MSIISRTINDRFGHAAGDEVLEAIGNIVRAELRSSDIAGRLGGDEFCFALPGIDENEAARVAERIRERLSTLAFGMGSGSPFSVTATFGVARSEPRRGCEGSDGGSRSGALSGEVGRPQPGDGGSLTAHGITVSIF